MPRNGSGNFSYADGDFVTNTVISSTVVNSKFSDTAQALSASIAKDGQTVPTANLPMGTYRHTGVGNATARTDYAAAGQVQDDSLVWCGTAGGTKNALTLTPSPAISSYTTGQRFRFKAGVTQSDDAVTIAVSGLASKAAQINDSALSASLYIEANKHYEALYDGASFQITRLSPAQAYSDPMTTRGDILYRGASGTTRLAAGVAGQVLTTGGPGADPSWSNASSGTETITAGEDLADRDAIYCDVTNQRGGGAGKWYKIDADATGPVKVSRVRGIALEAITSGNTGTAQVGPGLVTGLSGLTSGQMVYASGTAGAVTQTEPAVPSSGTQNAVIIIGRSLTTTTMQFEPWHDVVFQARNSALDSGSSITVEHWTDSGARERMARAYIASAATLTTDQMPAFSDYVSGNWTITSSNDSNGAAWYAGDNGQANYWNTNAAQGQWWATEYTGAAVTIGGYSIQADEIYQGRAPQSWTYEGWNGSAWVVLDTQTNVGAWSASQVRTYTLSSPITLGSGGTYSKTRFNITAHYGGTTLVVDEFQQLGISTVRDEPVDIGSETIDASATTKVTVKFSDTSDANQDTKTTFYNRTNATRDLISEVTL